MKTPEEKAKELVDRFKYIVDGEDYFEKAKQCALICAEQNIMTADRSLFADYRESEPLFWCRYKSYWAEVITILRFS